MTAVEWLVQRMKHICKWDEYMLLENLGHIDKAKQMEEKQRIMDYEMGYINGGNQKKITGEQYLNNLTK